MKEDQKTSCDSAMVVLDEDYEEGLAMSRRVARRGLSVICWPESLRTTLAEFKRRVAARG
jgi:hypothetical protein